MRSGAGWTQFPGPPMDSAMGRAGTTSVLAKAPCTVMAHRRCASGRRGRIRVSVRCRRLYRWRRGSLDRRGRPCSSRRSRRCRAGSSGRRGDGNAWRIASRDARAVLRSQRDAADGHGEGNTDARDEDQPPPAAQPITRRHAPSPPNQPSRSLLKVKGRRLPVESQGKTSSDRANEAFVLALPLHAARVLPPDYQRLRRLRLLIFERRKSVASRPDRTRDASQPLLRRTR